MGQADKEEDRTKVTLCAARCGLETAIAFFEQEGHGERALQVADILRFLDNKVGFIVSVQMQITSFFAK